VLAAFAWFFRSSRHGIAMRAVADDQQAALTMGISVRRVFALAWALAAVSALVAGVLLADLSAVDQNIAAFGLIVFPVVILGGLDSVPGTIVGGLTIRVFAKLICYEASAESARSGLRARARRAVIPAGAPEASRLVKTVLRRIARLTGPLPVRAV